MFSTPPPRSRRHYETTVQTRSAWKKAELIKKMMKEGPTREVKSEILKKTEGDCLQRNAHSLMPNVSPKKHSSSEKSIEARKMRLEYEAAKQKADIERKAVEKNAQLEKTLVEQKLAADIAALESVASKSRRSSQYQPTEIDSIGKVQEWLENSHIAENKNNSDMNAARDGERDAAAEGFGGTDMQNLVSAIYQSNLQNKQLLSRFASSKDLPQFNGDPLEWLAYKLAYDESTKICKYSDAENMWRLRKSLKGEAKETVCSLLIGNTAPHIIIEALELRYGRPETIIHKITYQLKKIPPLSQNYHHEIVSFSIKIKNYVAAVKAVNQTDYLRSPELVSNVLTKCPSALINKWADYYGANCNIQTAKLEMLAEFLYNEANKISAAGLTHLHIQSDYRKKPEERRPHSVLLGAKRDVTRCQFCKISNHKLPECARFKRALTKDRWRFVRVNNLCHKCLLATHSHDNCSAASCPVDECGLPHHRLLHWKSKTSANSEKSESENKTNSDDNKVLLTSDKTVDQVNNDCPVSNETVANAVDSSKSCVFLKVVPVNIHGPKGVFRTHALMDDGATVSLIAADIANRVGLHGQKQTLRVRGAWDSELMCDSEQINCKITSINNDSFDISMRKISELNLPLQKISNINLKDYEHLYHLNSYISCSENVKPMILIGQDNYHLIAPIKTIIRSKSEPCATLTPLGWCVHGVCPSKRQYSSTVSECAMVTLTVEQLRRPPAPAPSCQSRHACNSATANTSPLAAVHTGACETTADASALPQYTLTKYVSTERCTCCRHDAIHTDIESDAQLHELVKKSFTFESLGVHNKPRKNKDECKAIEMVEKSAKLINGKWEVGLPWKDENAKMASSFCNAYRRLKTIERKMSTDQGFALRYKERKGSIISPNRSTSASETTELHLFCDASPVAYAAVAYWRVHTDNSNVCVSFIASKSRVRTVEIKTKTGVLLTRPVTRLALLPIANGVPDVTLGGECRRRASQT
ncbi:reverse transcriptase [Operophtera brumata]|uniref:Reverse transcriptase n=1 Tax=Operophtera brumata TaxID=104452 RepID=A0A0L7KW57_OPEBR|nr:reverse transcriptase [Operophtera brumata]